MSQVRWFTFDRASGVGSSSFSSGLFSSRLSSNLSSLRCSGFGSLSGDRLFSGRSSGGLELRRLGKLKKGIPLTVGVSKTDVETFKLM
jgi:hypothetical protein